MARYFWLVFVLIAVYLIVTHADSFKGVINSLSLGSAGTIVALQGGDPSAFKGA